MGPSPSRAGVERHTLYAHFPDERALFRACSEHWGGHGPRRPQPRGAGRRRRSRAPPLPSPRRPSIRGTSRLQAAVPGAVPPGLSPRPLECGGPRRAYHAGFAPLTDALAHGLPRRKSVPRGHRAHASSFETRRSLVRRQGLLAGAGGRCDDALSRASQARPLRRGFLHGRANVDERRVGDGDRAHGPGGPRSNVIQQQHRDKGRCEDDADHAPREDCEIEREQAERNGGAHDLDPEHGAGHTVVPAPRPAPSACRSSRSTSRRRSPPPLGAPASASPAERHNERCNSSPSAIAARAAAVPGTALEQADASHSGALQARREIRVRIGS